MIYVKNKKDIELMRESCRLTKMAINFVGEHIKPGITTGELDKITWKHLSRHFTLNAHHSSDRNTVPRREYV